MLPSFESVRISKRPKSTYSGYRIVTKAVFAAHIFVSIMKLSHFSSVDKPLDKSVDKSVNFKCMVDFACVS